MSAAKPMGNPRRLAVYLNQKGLTRADLSALSGKQRRRLNRKAWRAQRALGVTLEGAAS